MTRTLIYGPQYKLMVLFVDLIFLILSVIGVYYFRFQMIDLNLILTSMGLWFILFVHIASLYVFGTYDVDVETRSIEMAGRIVVASLTAVFFVIVIHYFGGHDRTGLFGRGVLLGSLGVNFIVCSFLRRKLLHRARKNFGNTEWLFILTEAFHEKLKKDLIRNRYPGQIHFLNERNMNEIREYLKKRWTGIIVGLERNSLLQEPELGRLLMNSRFEGQRVYDLMTFYERQWLKVPIYVLDVDWFVLSEGFQIFHNSIGLKLKRLIDLFMSSTLLILASPVMLLAAIIIKLESTGPVIYTQNRTGKDGRLFTIFKFRSMRSDAEKAGAQWASANDNRITRVGRFIRITRIDELPQLINIIKGDMSFVGPRPERPEFNTELEKVIPFYQLRHMVKPGLSGWAQVLYPYGASIDDAIEKLQYELYYIKNQSVFMDFLIVLKTIRVVIFGRGR